MFLYNAGVSCEADPLLFMINRAHIPHTFCIKIYPQGSRKGEIA